MNSLQQFDRVQIITTKRVSFLSDRVGVKSDPHGLWSVIGIIDHEALIAKGSTLVCIPISDITKVGEYRIESVMQRIEELFHGKGQERTGI